jgi:hypothetical protein
MCVLCGAPDPSHDMMIVRGVVLAGGTGFILTPRTWLRQLKDAVLHKLLRGRPIHDVRTYRVPWTISRR